MVPWVTCTTGRPAPSAGHHDGGVKSVAGAGATAPTKRTWSGRSVRRYSNSGTVGTITRSASTAESNTNTGSFGASIASSIPWAAACDGRSRTLWANSFSARLRNRPSTPLAGRRPVPPGAVSRLLRNRGVVVYVRMGGRPTRPPSSSGKTPRNVASTRTASKSLCANSSSNAAACAGMGLTNRLVMSKLSRAIPDVSARPGRSASNEESS